MPASTFTTDHPGWIVDAGAASRVVSHDGVAWLAQAEPDSFTVRPLEPTTGPPPEPISTSATELPRNPAASPLLDALAGLGTVLRLPNPSLWDAITTAILRQVVRAPQARAVYWRWCQAHGCTFDTPLGRHVLPPPPEVVAALDEDAFAGSGTKFHRTALQAAADAYLAHHSEWQQLSPAALVNALCAVPRIGPWTASAAAADRTGDFAIYPHGDLAVRTWAQRAAPALPFPEREREFAAHWREITHSRNELHALTLYTLTWGSHDRTAQHANV